MIKKNAQNDVQDNGTEVGESTLRMEYKLTYITIVILFAKNMFVKMCFTVSVFGL